MNSSPPWQKRSTQFRRASQRDQRRRFGTRGRECWQERAGVRWREVDSIRMGGSRVFRRSADVCAREELLWRREGHTVRLFVSLLVRLFVCLFVSPACCGGASGVWGPSVIDFPPRRSKPLVTLREGHTAKLGVHGRKRVVWQIEGQGNVVFSADDLNCDLISSRGAHPYSFRLTKVESDGMSFLS